ncbi:MAG: LacI family DNA-binding transcriptional regulator [Cellulomonadaceae bacterium]
MPTDRVTILDVAAHAGVAISSASAALNGRKGVSEATRERVRAAAQDLGYVPSMRARSLSAKRAFAIGFVLQRPPDVLESDPYFGAFLGGIEEALGPRGYALVLHQASTEHDAELRYRELAANRRVDGVLLDEVTVDDARVDLVRAVGLPSVGIVPEHIDFPLPAVRQDSGSAVRGLVRMLAAQGHQRIAHVSGAARFVHTRERETAWRLALEELGLEPGPVVAGHFSYAGGRQAADRLFGPEAVGTGHNPLPTAVVCANDLSAVGLMVRLRELGYDVPADVSVTGFDGNALGTYVRPALTTVQTTPRHRCCSR